MPNGTINTKAGLENEANLLKESRESLVSLREGNKINAKELKVKLIRDLFSIMKKSGVDPRDLGAINGFLQSLEEQDPDLKEIFEVAFNNLIGDRDVNPQAPQPSQPESAGLMNQLSNPQERMRSPQPQAPQPNISAPQPGVPSGVL